MSGVPCKFDLKLITWKFFSSTLTFKTFLLPCCSFMDVHLLCLRLVTVSGAFITWVIPCDKYGPVQICSQGCSDIHVQTCSFAAHTFIHIYSYINWLLVFNWKTFLFYFSMPISDGRSLTVRVLAICRTFKLSPWCKTRFWDVFWLLMSAKVRKVPIRWLEILVMMVQKLPRL